MSDVIQEGPTTTIDNNNGGTTNVYVKPEGDNVGEPVLVKWTNRKNMAWVALWAMIGMAVVIVVGLTVMITLKVTIPVSMLFIDDLIFWYYFSMSSVIFSYMGFTTLPFIGKNKPNMKVQGSDY